MTVSPLKAENRAMSEVAQLSNQEVVSRIQQKMQEKDEVIREQMVQLEEKEQSLKQRDELIQELQERISQLEKSAQAREELVSSLSVLLD